MNFSNPTKVYWMKQNRKIQYLEWYFVGRIAWAQQVLNYLRKFENFSYKIGGYWDPAFQQNKMFLSLDSKPKPFSIN